ncbi:MAG: hypothetical protein LIO69_00940 [Oscillospiraceae bacterium]|nr:hypothetical protein [Oscillospiraceae bacterium]
MEAKFHLPGLMQHFRLNLTLIEYMKSHPNYFMDGASIGSVYGAFPNMLWNGGRYMQGHNDARIIKEIFHQLNMRGIPVRLTFTNPMLTYEHLADPLCNAVMDIANNGLNEVIVFSPLLEDYIRDKYPNYPITSSTCKQIEDYEELCGEMDKDYSLIVLDYNWNNQFDILEKLPHKEKAEILVNSCCTPHCKRRSAHYQAIGRGQIGLTKSIAAKEKSFAPEPFTCECMTKTLYQTVDSPLHITPDAIYGKYVPMGYKNFKIEGRTVPDVNILENMVYYMVKPEYRDVTRLEMLLMLTKNTKNFQ